jgi:hypothetical protein
MVVRALICCTALVLGLLAALSATAQSAAACTGAACRATEKSRPLDLMSFMRGRAKANNGTGRQTAAKTATQSPKSRHVGRSTAHAGGVPDSAPQTQPASLPAAAAAAYAAVSQDVQVVTGDQLNVIDLAMVRTPSETVDAAPRAEPGEGTPVKLADAGEVREDAPKSAARSALKTPPTRDDAPRDDAPHDDSWIGRFWATIGDGFVALVAMLRQLFA